MVDRVMHVILGCAIGAIVGGVIGLLVAAFASRSDPAAGATAWLVLIFVGAGVGIWIGVALGRGSSTHSKRVDYYSTRIYRDPRAAENWHLLDYWEMTYRNIDSRLVAERVERVRPDFVRVTARFAGTPVTLTHSAARHDGGYTIATRWDDLRPPELRRQLSRAWWRSDWWS